MRRIAWLCSSSIYAAADDDADKDDNDAEEEENAGEENSLTMRQTYVHTYFHLDPGFLLSTHTQTHRPHRKIVGVQTL